MSGHMLLWKAAFAAPISANRAARKSPVRLGDWLRSVAPWLPPFLK